MNQRNWKKIYVHLAKGHKILIEGIIDVINIDKNIEIRDYSSSGKEVIDWFDKKGKFNIITSNGNGTIIKVELPIEERETINLL